MSVSYDTDTPFYWGMIRKYIICFSSIFSTLAIQKFDTEGNVVKTVNVPYSVSMKNKLYYKENKKDTPINLTLPRLEYRFTSMIPDPIRSNPKKQTFTATIDETEEEYIYAGKPWNFDIEVKVLSKTLGELFQIIENIMVKFDPDYILSIKEIPNVVSRDVQIISNSIILPDDYDLDETTNRQLEATLMFTLKGYLYPPIENSKIIKQIQLEYQTKQNDVITQDVISIIEDLDT